jgi:LysR family cys regulon transcriptional activator
MVIHETPSTAVKLQHLKSFGAIAQHDLNVTRAAAHLHATQPGLSKHVKALEEELGVKLFVRQRNRYTALTDAGTRLLPIALRAIAAADELAHTARDLAKHTGDALTIAASPTPARFFLPTIVHRFSERYPRTRLKILEGNSSHSIDCLLRGEADLCVSSAPATPIRALAFTPCYELHWLLLAPRGHPLLRARPLTLATIARHPIITYDKGFASRAVIVEAFRDQGLTPDIALEALDGDMMRRYVLSGVGVAFIAAAAAADLADPGLVTIDVGALVPPIRIHVGVRRGVRPRAAAAHLLRLILST